MQYAARGEAFGIAQSVRELPPEDRQLVRKLVELMTAARADTRLHAQTMIRETLAFDVDARERCVETIDATIRYLERQAASIHNAS